MIIKSRDRITYFEGEERREISLTINVSSTGLVLRLSRPGINQKSASLPHEIILDRMIAQWLKETLSQNKHPMRGVVSNFNIDCLPVNDTSYFTLRSPQWDYGLTHPCITIDAEGRLELAAFLGKHLLSIEAPSMQPPPYFGLER